MADPPRTYSGRRALIAEILEPYLNISGMVPKNARPTSETAEMFWDNSFWCSWGDRDTGSSETLTVSICQVPDGEERAEDVRDMMKEECAPGLDFQKPNPEAYEIVGQRPGEHVFVLDYLGTLTAIVGNCFVEIMLLGIEIDLSELAEAALDIGRSVGCSAYENDFTLPDYPDEWRNQSVGWSTPGFPPYLPGLADPTDLDTT